MTKFYTTSGAIIGLLVFAALINPAPVTTVSNNNNSQVTDPKVRGSAQMMIILNGYKCQNLKSMQRNTFSMGFTIKCDEYYQYQLKDVGGNWRVTVD